MARKYSQRGYMEDERREGEPPRDERGGRRRRQGPGGRGLGAPTATRFKCARCAARLDDGEPALDATCPECGDDLHSCVNCRFFDTAAPNECRAGVEERIAAKSRRNECPSFERKLVQEFAADSEAPDDARAAFDSLFDF